MAKLPLSLNNFITNHCKYKTEENTLIESIIKTTKPDYFIAGTFYCVYVFDNEKLIKEISAGELVDGVYFKRQVDRKAVGDLASIENQFEFNLNFELDLDTFELTVDRSVIDKHKDTEKKARLVEKSSETKQTIFKRLINKIKKRYTANTHYVYWLTDLYLAGVEDVFNLVKRESMNVIANSKTPIVLTLLASLKEENNCMALRGDIQKMTILPDKEKEESTKKDIFYMKKQLFIVSALFLSMFGFSQGIAFEHGTWKEVLEKSKQTGKPIFVDVYTSWCGPCKRMSKEIFPLAEVGKVYNTHFICYQVDAEKGDGIEIAKKYIVEAYPTFLFIKADESLFSRSSGSMDAKSFIEIVNTTLADMNDPKPLVEWEKEYPLKKNDPMFILNYMEKRAKFGLPNAFLFDEYLKLIPNEKRTSDSIKEIYEKVAGELKINSFAYENFQKNITKFDNGLVNEILRSVVYHTTTEAARLKDEQMLAAVIVANDQLLGREEFPKDYPLPCVSSLESKEEIYKRYYQLTGETEKYLKYATDICNNKLMKISSDSLYKKDQKNIQLIQHLLTSDKGFASQDSTNLARTKTYFATAETFKVSAGLNSTAWTVFEKVSDINILKDALRWSNRALELTPKNPHWIITNANLLYKLGQKEEAINQGERALRFADKNNIGEYKDFEDNLLKMKAGEKTWE